MNGFIAGIASMFLIAVGAALVLENMDYSSQSNHTSGSGSVRLDK